MDALMIQEVQLKPANLGEVRHLLREHIKNEISTEFGVTDDAWVERATNNWFDDQNNYDGRWSIISDRLLRSIRVLGMAAGCGTFFTYGLHRGYDVWGVEPSEWKRDYFRKKVAVSGYSSDFLLRIVPAVGEALPFPDETFDLVTTYQTLEHVQDVGRCLQEMLRVLKPNGVLFIQAPDYNCFFEGHYRVPILPMMNRKLVAAYLRFLGRPLSGLDSLQWVTERELVRLLRQTNPAVIVERTRNYWREKRLKRIQTLLPEIF